MDYIPIPKALRAKNINGYSESAQKAKTAFHKEGKAMLRKLAAQLGLEHGCDFRLTSNVAGPAVCGEVTLHADRIYIQLSESCTQPGADILYRTCKTRTDYSGGPNKYVTISEFAKEDAQRRVIECMQAMLPAPVSA